MSRVVVLGPCASSTGVLKKVAELCKVGRSSPRDRRRWWALEEIRDGTDGGGG